MEIKKNIPFILSDLYEYDFSACAYNILKNVGWDTSNIPFDDKLQRNIQIGLIQRNNQNLSAFMTKTIDQLVDHYLNTNNADAIVRAKDGFITNKKLKLLDDTMPLTFRNLISKIIFDINRSYYLAILTNGEVIVKGMRDRPIDVSFYKLFRNLNFTNNKSLLDGLENMRKIIYESDNIKWFTRQIDETTIEIPILNEGILKINKSFLPNVDDAEVDKSFIWDEFIWPFAQAILIHCSSKKR